MIFAQGDVAGPLMTGAALAPLVMIAGWLVDARVLQGACSLVNWIAPGPHGTNLVPRPRFGKALGIVALAVAVESVVTWFFFILAAASGRGSPGLIDTCIAFLVGFIAMSVVVARMLGGPLWKTAVVMFVPSVIAVGSEEPRIVAQPRNLQTLRARRSSPLGPVWHSHTTSTPHPIRRNARRCIASRARFPSSFLRQNAARVVGIERPLLHAWRCQKQPWTKTTFRRLGKTRSGVPGSPLWCRRKRYPSRCTNLRTFNSGAEPFPRMTLMIARRFALENTSAIASPRLPR
jgi:hypothetical protein